MLILLIIIFCFIFSKKENIEYFKCNTPKFVPHVWNNVKNNIKKFNNCYAYALRNLKLNRKKKPQPGDECGIPNIIKKDYQDPNICNIIYKKMKCDLRDTITNEKLFKINNNADCPCNYYKFALFLDTRVGKEDYHFYRQDSNNLWSHKPGKTSATNLDADNKLIYNPLNADRKYSKHNYNKFCGFYCKKFEENINIDK